MNRADDEIDNLFRNHFAGELDPMRGQAARAFDRQITGPMRRSLRLTALSGVRARVRHAVPLAMTMAACCAVGYFAPRWLSADAPAAREIADVTPTPAAKPDDGLRREWQRNIESASFSDPATQSRTEIITIPAESPTSARQ